MSFRDLRQAAFVCATLLMVCAASPARGDDGCELGQTVLERLERSDLVFTGRLVATERLERIRWIDADGESVVSEGHRLDYEVWRFYKGGLPSLGGVKQRVVVHAIEDFSQPRFYFTQGYSNLVFAETNVPGSITFGCSLNRISPNPDYQADVEVLDDAVAEAEADGCGFGSPFGMLQSVALLGLGAAVMRRRDRAIR